MTKRSGKLLIGSKSVMSVLGKPSMQPSKPAIEPEEGSIPAANSIRTRKQWLRLKKALQVVENFNDWMSLMFDFLVTPKYAKVVYTKYSQKSGRPVEFKWVSDKSSAMLRFDLIQTREKFKPEVTKALAELMTTLEKGKLPILYSTAIDESGDVSEVVRRIIASRDYVSLGGGHNDSDTYAYALVLTPVVDEWGVLSGSIEIPGV